MHEASLTVDLVGKAVAVSEVESGARVTQVEVRIGALSHIDADNLAVHFEASAADTAVAGAELVATVDTDVTAPNALDVVLTAVRVEED